MTILRISSKLIEALPMLPPNLQHLHVTGCSKLRMLPKLPPTLRQLECEDCTSLKALPGSLSSTAVTQLTGSTCSSLESLPQLPISLVELDVQDCSNLMELPMLPQGLKRLVIKGPDPAFHDVLDARLKEVSTACCTTDYLSGPWAVMLRRHCRMLFNVVNT
jgi:hypothetical protein